MILLPFARDMFYLIYLLLIVKVIFVMRFLIVLYSVTLVYLD